MRRDFATPLTYYGGKQNLVKHLLPLLPPHKVYVEPFCGGCALLWAKGLPRVFNNNTGLEVINDTNGRLINFWRMLRDRGDELATKLQLTPYAKDEYTLGLEPSDDELEDARRFFASLQQAFSHKWGAGWGRSVVMSQCKLWNNRVDGFAQVYTRIRNVHIEHVDALACIKNWDSPDTLFYVDPPYPATDQGHYKGYTAEDFAALVETLDGIQGSYLLSCYDFEGMRVPANAERFPFQTLMCACKEISKRGARTEVVYRRLAQHVAMYEPTQTAMGL